MKSRNETTFLLLRPPLANEAALDITTLHQERENEQFNTEEVWSRRRITEQCNHVKELVESISRHIQIPVRMLEAQLRRRTNPHPTEHSLDQHHQLLSQTDIIASLYPTYNQVKHLCRQIQANVIQQLLILLEDMDSRDTVIQDFRDMLTEGNVLLLSATEAGLASKEYNRIFVTSLQHDTRIEEAVERMLVFKQAMAA